MNYIFDVEYFLGIFPEILPALRYTAYMTVFSTIIAFVLGCIIACVGYYKIKVLNPIFKVYISFMRSVPLIVLLYLFYYGLAKVSTFVMNMSALNASTLVLGLYMSGFMAETIRAALVSVDPGQKEAAEAFGMNQVQLIVKIILPQAFRVALPPLFNDFINLLKLSALSFMLGVKDVMGAAKAEATMSLRFLEVYCAVAIVYWVIIVVLSIFQKKLETKLQKAF